MGSESDIATSWGAVACWPSLRRSQRLASCLRRRAPTWSVTRMDNVGGLTSISCPSPSLCVATDDSLHLISSRKPLGLASAWHRFKGRGWPGNDGNPNDYFGQPFGYNGIACVSTRLCVAVDNDGDIVASKHPAGGRSAWHGALVDCGECLMANSGDLTAVSCTPTAVCVGADPSDGDYNTRHPFNLDDWNAPTTRQPLPMGSPAVREDCVCSTAEESSPVPLHPEPLTRSGSGPRLTRDTTSMESPARPHRCASAWITAATF